MLLIALVVLLLVAGAYFVARLLWCGCGLPRWKLYRMLATAEQAAGRTGRPEAVDSIDEIFALLDTLARRTAGQRMGSHVLAA
jgi:hypothetical protein